MSRLRVFLAVILIGTQPARAGTPIDIEKVCPLDGESFTITGTASCSTFGSTMTLKRVTSCDFVTVLPVCPGSDFPMYRPFGEAEVGRLRDWVKTPEYQALRERSRFYRAWAVETWLGAGRSGGLSPSEKCGMLIGGLSRQPRPGIADADYRALMLGEADAAIADFAPEVRPMLEALMAFIEIHNGQRDAAAARLAGLRDAAAADAYLKSYVDSIAACLTDPAAPTCDPDAEIPR